MRRTRSGFVIAAFLGLLVALPAPLGACGPWFPDAVFWLTDRPNEPIERFLDGHFGIIDQSLAPQYRYVVYRHLAGVGLNQASRAPLAAYWGGVPGGTDPYDLSAMRRWIEARSRVGGLRPEEVDPWRRSARTQGDEVVELSYRNCLDDAFDTAVKTLARLTTEYSGNSPVVTAWAVAQDQVFSNCSQGHSIPGPLGEDSPADVRADRDYQIAAAYFYAGDFDEAEKRFRAIAADPGSPWQAISTYLVGRALLRRGMLAEPPDTEALRAAEAQFHSVAGNPNLAALHDAANRLRDYAALRLDPPGQEQKLRADLLRPNLEANAVQQFIDYRRTLAYHRDGLPPDGLARWLAGVSCEECADMPPLANQLAVAAWSDGSLMKEMPGPDTGSARLTLAYYWARHLQHHGEVESARAVLDDLLAGGAGELSLGDRNRVLAARAPLATSLEEYLRLSQMVPVGARAEVYSPLDPEKQQILLSDDALDALAVHFTPALLAQALETEQLAPALARRVAVFAWMKANLVGDEESASRIVPWLRKLAPEMRADVDSYAAAHGEARRFAFALASLRFPGARPQPGRPIARETPIQQVDSFGDNWWCAGMSQREDVLRPAFLAAAEAEKAAAANARLREVASAPQFLGEIVFAWADAHPDDPRVPEALHRLVKSTRYSHCGRGDGGETSQRAFTRLHRQYPNSPWTQKTPYWFSWS